MSRNATRGGPMMIGPASTRFNLNISSDRRKAFSFGTNFDVNDDRLGDGGRTSIRGDLFIRPSDNLEIQLNPRYESSRSGGQYVTATSAVPYAPTYGERYLFADLDRESFSLETRVNWTFTPTLSLQLYAQPLLSSGDYVQYKQLAEPESYDFRAFQAGTSSVLGNTVLCSSSICELDGDQYVDFDSDGTTDYSFSDRDFNVRSLVGNAVLRWEYRPGSAIFLVWQRRQQGSAQVGDFDFGRDVDALFAAPADDRFIIKVNYWLPI